MSILNFGHVRLRWRARIFIRHAASGYYDGALFHRVIRNTLAQTGDPTGEGRGGQSAFTGGAAFKDEFHQRLKFNHRGLVGMANENKPHTNKSQFFITLGKCEWLTGKHTIFGKVTGDTIFNALKLNEVDTDSATDRPLEPVAITGAEILSCPFPSSPMSWSKMLSKRVQGRRARVQKLLHLKSAPVL